MFHVKSVNTNAKNTIISRGAMRLRLYLTSLLFFISCGGPGEWSIDGIVCEWADDPVENGLHFTSELRFTENKCQYNASIIGGGNIITRVKNKSHGMHMVCKQGITGRYWGRHDNYTSYRIFDKFDWEQTRTPCINNNYEFLYDYESNTATKRNLDSGEVSEIGCKPFNTVGYSGRNHCEGGTVNPPYVRNGRLDDGVYTPTR